MAAYAIASAKQKIDQLLYSKTRISYHLPTRDTLGFYFDLLDLELIISEQRSKKLRAVVLEKQIEDVVDKFEDLIGSRFSSFEGLLDIVLEMTSLREKLKKGEYKIEGDLPPIHFLLPDDDILFGRYDSILGRSPRHVGLVREINHLAYKVMKGSSKLKALVVFGMAGCGKTTLVKQTYKILLNNYDIHCMLTIPLNFTLREVLVCLLTSLGFRFDSETNEMMGESELGMSLTKILKGKRYFCVLDALWDSYIWNKLCMFFPDENNGSRIICPVRDTPVLFEGSIPLEFWAKRLLSDDDSWELLRMVTFPTEQFDNPQFEEIGKEIAKKCEGLPLAIIAMGKLLSESEKSIKRWEQVLKDDDPFQIMRGDGQLISKSLYLSYDLLPYHLKLCFLYMGVLSKDYEMKPSELIMLWIAEGLVSPEEDKSLEDTAMQYLSKILHQSMLLIKKQSSSIHGKDIKTFQVHFIFRSLCIREAQNQTFSLALKKYAQIFSEGLNLQQRLSIQNNILLGFKEVHNFIQPKSSVSSILYSGPRHQYPLRVYLKFHDLKILHALSIHFYEFPLEVLELFRLRYLAITYNGQVPRSVSKLWKLEFLILGRYHKIKSPYVPSFLPMEIWNLQWLKHIQCIGLDLRDPNSTGNNLECLLELTGVSAHSCTPEILARMHNLKKLVVHLELLEDEVESFSFFSHVAQNLHCLNSFKCFVFRVFNSPMVSPAPVFPSTICKLCLSGCGFPWKYMSVICVLPNLEKLKLQEHSFDGPTWEVCEGAFRKLAKLILKDLNIKEWRVKSQQFPQLLWLEIHHCYSLHEIPTVFGDHQRLSRVLLFGNNATLEKSARQLLRDDNFELGVTKLGSTEAYMAVTEDYNLLTMQIE